MNLPLTRIINIFVLSGVALGLAFTALPADAATLAGTIVNPLDPQFDSAGLTGSNFLRISVSTVEHHLLTREISAVSQQKSKANNQCR